MKLQEPADYLVWLKYKRIFQERIKKVIDAEILKIKQEYKVNLELDGFEDIVYDWRIIT